MGREKLTKVSFIYKSIVGSRCLQAYGVSISSLGTESSPFDQQSIRRGFRVLIDLQASC